MLYQSSAPTASKAEFATRCHPLDPCPSTDKSKANTAVQDPLISITFLPLKHHGPDRLPEKMALGNTIRDGAAPLPARHQVGGFHSPSPAADRAPSPPRSSLSGIPALLRNEQPAHPLQLSLSAISHGEVSASAPHAVLSPAEMSAILLSLPMRQDMDNIAARLESPLRQDIATVTQAVQVMEAT